ncbi:MAG: cyclohexanecarboxylate-CoA ligase, partial [Acidimicrobiales bacterium]
MLEARNIWDLIVRRAAETPEGELAVDEIGRRITFGAYRERVERVAAGLASDRAVSEGAVVSWIQPSWIEAMVL